MKHFHKFTPNKISYKYVRKNGPKINTSKELKKDAAAYDEFSKALTNKILEMLKNETYFKKTKELL